MRAFCRCQVSELRVVYEAKDAHKDSSWISEICIDLEDGICVERIVETEQIGSIVAFDGVLHKTTLSTICMIRGLNNSPSVGGNMTEDYRVEPKRPPSRPSPNQRRRRMRSRYHDG